MSVFEFAGLFEPHRFLKNLKIIFNTLTRQVSGCIL